MSAASAQEPPAPPAGQELPWPVRLGARAALVRRAFPTVDRVVLVPDGATYIDELFRWSPQGRWPVLLEDDHLAPMFVRRFKPRQIIRREPVASGAMTAASRRPMAEAVVVSAWGGDPAVLSVRQTFDRLAYEPPGVVIASMDDPAWTAAVALAAGRGLPLAWLEEDVPAPTRQLPVEDARRLAGAVERLVRAQGYPCDGLGDVVDAVAVCINLPARVRADPFAAAGPPADGAKAGPVAITDILGRGADGRRFAIAGWVFGTEVQAAYMAMCSLFLERTSVELVDGYGQARQWAGFHMGPAADRLRRQGYQVRLTDGDRAGAMGWRRMIAGGAAADLWMINSMGMTDFFQLQGDRLAPRDVPLLSEPAAVHLVHSWSLRDPADPGTVGGRWLQRGAYAIVGSSHEPFLQAFMPPELLVRRLESYVPLLVAARHWEGALSDPWRINTIGDPLMLCPPPSDPAGVKPPPRREPDQRDGEDLRRRTRRLLQAARDDPTGRIPVEAMTLLVLIGQDELAASLWALAEQRGQQAAVARAALGPLFRQQQTESFLRAYAQAGSREADDREMLWHLLSSRLGPSTSPQTLQLLESSLRGSPAHIDLERLAPHLRRSFGADHVRTLIQRQIELAASEEDRKHLRELLEMY